MSDDRTSALGTTSEGERARWLTALRAALNAVEFRRHKYVLPEGALLDELEARSVEASFAKQLEVFEAVARADVEECHLSKLLSCVCLGGECLVWFGFVA